jgi:hypothetical protein
MATTKLKPRIDFDGGAFLNDGVPVAQPDPQCVAAWKNHEADRRSCGLGLELVLAMPFLAGLRRIARHAVPARARAARGS